MAPALPPPQCIGDFDPGHPQCDGDTEDPIPCAWRDKCGAFQAWATSGGDREQWVDPGTGLLQSDPAAFNDFCLGLAERLEVIQGRTSDRIPQIRLEGAKRPPPRRRELQDRVQASASRWRHVSALTGYLLQLILARLGPRASSGDEAVPQGGAYVVDHREPPTGYVALRLRRSRGHDRPVLTLRLRPRLRALELHLPIPLLDAEHLAEETRGYHVRAIARGRFRSAFNVTQGSDLPRLANEVVRWVEGG